MVNGLQTEYAGRAEILKHKLCDPRTAEAKAKCNFRAQPYFVPLNRDGEVVSTWQGFTEKAFCDGQFAALLGW